ncbi:MAG: 4-phosphopantetheinyl transferase family protein [Flavobacterium sp.]|nr:MAG: 4-phosphopantetheinyl transferase family protein [Flavobacterium sp.]
MIGNDVIDLELANTESNWKRKGFLNKIFTGTEQQIIQSAENPELMVWILWSCKEAGYKIYNRASLKRGFMPLFLDCNLEFSSQQISGKVKCFEYSYYLKTEVTQNYIYTVAVEKYDSFQHIREFDKGLNIIKQNGIPFLENSKSIVSITHHGRFDRRILLDIN